MSLKGIVEETDTAAGRWFDRTIMALILVSLVSFSVETLPDLGGTERRILRYLEIGTVTVFTGEYLARLTVADSKIAFVTSFFGLVDLMAILPFYVATGIDLRAVRAFRLFRLIRILKLVRYSEAVRRFHRAFVIAKEEIVLFFSVACMLIYLAAVGIYYFERAAQPDVFSSIFASLWWAVATLTTVGYGDVYPVTAGGKVFTFAVLMIGLGIVAVPAGLVGSALDEARKIEDEGQED